MPRILQGDHPLNFVPNFASSDPQNGFYRDIPLKLGDWFIRAEDGDAISALGTPSGTAPGVKLLDFGTNDVYGIQWVATGHDAIVTAFEMPGDYHEGPNNVSAIEDGDEFEVHMLMRRNGAGTDDVDLGFNVILNHLPRDATTATTATRGGLAPAAKTGLTTEASLTHLCYRWTNTGIHAGQPAHIDVQPTAAVGTNLALEIAAIWIRYNSCAALFDYTARETSRVGVGLNAPDFLDAS